MFNFALLKHIIFNQIPTVMENVTETKRVWECPEIEIINSKMTNSGGHPWYKEDAQYTDAYLS